MTTQQEVYLYGALTILFYGIALVSAGVAIFLIAQLFQ